MEGACRSLRALAGVRPIGLEYGALADAAYISKVQNTDNSRYGAALAYFWQHSQVLPWRVCTARSIGMQVVNRIGVTGVLSHR